MGILKNVFVQKNIGDKIKDNTNTNKINKVLDILNLLLPPLIDTKKIRGIMIPVKKVIKKIKNTIEDLICHKILANNRQITLACKINDLEDMQKKVNKNNTKIIKVVV